MPKQTKTKISAERPYLKATFGEAYFMTIDKFPHLTFWGKTKELAKRASLSELARAYPQGYSIEFDSSD